MTAPDALDFLDLDSELSSDETMIRDTVRRFVAERVMPDIEKWFDVGEFPREVATELGSLGLLGMHLEGYGCAGTNAVSYGLACLELEAGDSGFRSFVSVQGSLAMFPIWKYGSEEQKQRWLPPMAAGEAIGCFGLTEPDRGSDPSSMRTSARRDGDDWILNGTKMWITSGSVADVAVVWARTDDGVRGFLVPRGTPGFETRDIHRKLSLRASITSELILDDCRLPADSVLPGVTGMRGPLSCLTEARFGIVWGSMGAARACYESALEYSKTRVQFDKPIGAFQLTQRKLVDMLVEINKGMLLALHLGRRKDEGRLDPRHVSLGKLNNVREALAIAREARSILGANGITLEYPVIRHMNNLESVLTYEGTSEIHTLILGEAITGLERVQLMAPFKATPFTDDWRHFHFEISEGVATLTFDRPDKLNALTFDVYADLRDLLRELPSRDDVDVLVITGRGRGFCSGGDVHEIIGELLKTDARGLLDFTRMTGAVVQAMRECPLPIVASINGIAAGAGAVIALAADFRILARSAKVAFLFTKVGLAGADMGSAYLLPRLVGLSKATELLILGETIDADEADRLGLAYRVVEDGDLAGAAGELASRLAAGPTLAFANTKSLLSRELDMDLASSIELEAQTQALLMTSDDHAEFYRAFTEGRDPKWTGR